MLAALLAGCTTVPPQDRGVPDTTPPQAIMGAAESPDGIEGFFKFEVRGAGRQGDWLYLNSEADYRDQRCLTVAIPQAVAQALELKILGDPLELMKGRTIRVSGAAKRTTIWFLSNGVRTNSYYYQTQIRVSDISQIAVLADTSPTSPVVDRPDLKRSADDPRGRRYVDFVPTPSEIKAQLEQDGWTDVKVARSFPSYLQGPIRVLGLSYHPSAVSIFDPPKGYGRITSDRIEYLDLEFCADGFVTAPIQLPGGRRGSTFHFALKHHYVVITWDPADKSGYEWKSFVYDLNGTPVELRLRVQRMDVDRI